MDGWRNSGVAGTEGGVHSSGAAYAVSASGTVPGRASEEV